MSEPMLPFWAELLVSCLMVGAGLLTLIGSLGLLRLKTFYERVHAPTLGATLGCVCLVLATVLYFYMAESRLLGRAILICLFVVITAPLSAMMLIKAGIYRARRAEQASRLHEAKAPGPDQPASRTSPDVS